MTAGASTPGERRRGRRLGSTPHSRDGEGSHCGGEDVGREGREGQSECVGRGETWQVSMGAGSRKQITIAPPQGHPWCAWNTQCG